MGGIVRALGTLALLTFGGEAYAAMTCSGGGAPETVTLPASISVPDDVPIGSMLTNWVMGQKRGPYTCTITNGEFGGIAAWYEGSGSVVASVASPDASREAYVISTNVPGIGLAVAFNNRTCVRRNGTRGIHHGWAEHKDFPRVGGNACIGGNTTRESYTQSAFALVKTGDVQAGNVQGSNIVRIEPWIYRLKSTQPGGSWSPIYLSISPVKIVPQTCSLAAGDINRTISLPEVMVQDFDDSVYGGGYKNFKLTAECSNVSNVTFSFSGNADLNSNRFFANTGTAGGIGLWLFSWEGGRNRTITANGTNSARTVMVSSDKVELPLGAAYRRTGGVVSGGSLRSTVTVNISYD